jgi:hypothetical protein
VFDTHYYFGSADQPTTLLFTAFIASPRSYTVQSTNVVNSNLIHL